MANWQVQFQPIMDIHSGTIAGCEALMRWNHPQRGVVAPEEFVPLAERTGLIERLGRVAFEQAAGQAREWASIAAAARGLLRFGQPVARPSWPTESAAQRHARAGLRPPPDRPAPEARDHREPGDEQPRALGLCADRAAQTWACGWRSTISAPATPH